jgi:hypothetical protein
LPSTRAERIGAALGQDLEDLSRGCPHGTAPQIREDHLRNGGGCAQFFRGINESI